VEEGGVEHFEGQVDVGIDVELTCLLGAAQAHPLRLFQWLGQLLSVLGSTTGSLAISVLRARISLSKAGSANPSAVARMTSLRPASRSPVSGSATDCPSVSWLRARKAAKTTALFDGHRR
jgi:hypothetical protein